MKIERYSITRGHTDVWWEVVPDLEGSMCFYSDVKRLEARNAALLEACKAVYQVFGDEPCRLDHHGLCQSHHLRRNESGEPECEIAMLRAAIAKAEGGSDGD